MKLKKTISSLLLLFVAIACGVIVLKSFDKTSSLETASGQVQTRLSDTTAISAVAPETDIDVVYYFMTTQRCQNCMNIEAYTKEAVHDNFRSQLERKEIAWKMINLDEPQYTHFIKDFGLITKSVVLVRYREDKQVSWKNLDKVWNLLGDKVAFQDYIINEINAFVGAS